MLCMLQLTLLYVIGFMLLSADQWSQVGATTPTFSIEDTGLSDLSSDTDSDGSLCPPLPQATCISTSESFSVMHDDEFSDFTSQEDQSLSEVCKI